jgi:hypothetical protein
MEGVTVKSHLEILTVSFPVFDAGRGIYRVTGRLGTTTIDLLIVSEGEHARVEAKCEYGGGVIKQTFTKKPCLRDAITFLEEAVMLISADTLAFAGMWAVKRGLLVSPDGELERLAGAIGKAKTDGRLN